MGDLDQVCREDHPRALPEIQDVTNKLHHHRRAAPKSAQSVRPVENALAAPLPTLPAFSPDNALPFAAYQRFLSPPQEQLIDRAMECPESADFAQVTARIYHVLEAAFGPSPTCKQIKNAGADIESVSRRCPAR